MSKEEREGASNEEGDGVSKEESEGASNEEGDGVSKEESEGASNEEGDDVSNEERVSGEGDGREDNCPVCHVKGLACQWICCDNCDTWLHTQCTKANPDRLPDIFYCFKCV